MEGLINGGGMMQVLGGKLFYLFMIDHNWKVMRIIRDD